MCDSTDILTEDKDRTNSKFNFNLLKKGECVVEFLKKDNCLRKMRCTTNLNDIPMDKHPKGDSDNNDPAGYHRVFDLDIKAWRSFYEDKVVNFTFTGPILTAIDD